MKCGLKAKAFWRTNLLHRDSEIDCHGGGGKGWLGGHVVRRQPSQTLLLSSLLCADAATAQIIHAILCWNRRRFVGY